MADFETKGNTGVLFRNNKKKSEKQPDYQGNIKIGEDLIALIKSGADTLSISGWIRKSKNDSTYMSLALSKPYSKEDSSTPKPAAKPSKKEEDPNDLPF